MAKARSIYVTGISGQVGRHLGKRLRDEGFRVVGADKDPAAPGCCDELEQLDICSAEELEQSLARHRPDAVVHLAALVEPTEEPAQRMFAVNTAGTFNVCRAAARAGSPRLIYMSSESVLGFAFPVRVPPLEFLPIDESHPLRAHDPYGLSKLLGERVCAAYHDETGAPVLSLRPPWVWIPEKLERYVELVHDPGSWVHGLWAYVVVDDLDELIVAALHEEFAGTGTYYVAASDNGTTEKSRVLAETHYGFRGPYAADFQDRESLISSRAAQDRFGWSPRLEWQSWLERLASSAQMA